MSFPNLAFQTKLPDGAFQTKLPKLSFPNIVPQTEFSKLSCPNWAFQNDEAFQTGLSKLGIKKLFISAQIEFLVRVILASSSKKKSASSDFMVRGSQGSLQRAGAVGGNVETGQVSSVETREVSQLQSSVLSQRQTFVLSQQRTSILSQQKT